VSMGFVERHIYTVYMFKTITSNIQAVSSEQELAE